MIALPGVPREMKHLLQEAVLPWLGERFPQAGVIHMRVLRTAGVGESAIDERVRDLEDLGNPDVGLAAHAGRVDLRIIARAASAAEAKALLAPVEAEIRRRLGDWIYGVDEQSLAGATLARLAARDRRLASLECGSRGLLAGALCAEVGAEDRLARCELRPGGLGEPELEAALVELRAETGAELALGLSIPKASEGHPAAFILLLGPDWAERRTIPQAGHPELAAERAIAYALELVRRKL